MIISNKRSDCALDSIKSWTRGSVDYRTSRCHYCCNAADPSKKTSLRRRGCRRRRSGWSPTHRYLCTGRGRRILSHCTAADSLGRSIPQSFWKPQGDFTTKVNISWKIYGDHKWISRYVSTVQKLLPSVKKEKKYISKRPCKRSNQRERCFHLLEVNVAIRWSIREERNRYLNCRSRVSDSLCSFTF